jgi:hypothetical protein
MAKKKRYPLVWVVWLDSTFFKGTSAWLTREEARREAKGPVPTCQTAGFLVHEDKYGLTVALSINQYGGVADFIKIPRECVQSVHCLKVGRRHRRRR